MNIVNNRKQLGFISKTARRYFINSSFSREAAVQGPRVWLTLGVSILCMTVHLGKFPRCQSPRPQTDLCVPRKRPCLCLLCRNGLRERRTKGGNRKWKLQPGKQGPISWKGNKLFNSCNGSLGIRKLVFSTYRLWFYWNGWNNKLPHFLTQWPASNSLEKSGKPTNSYCGFRLAQSQGGGPGLVCYGVSQVWSVCRYETFPRSKEVFITR